MIAAPRVAFRRGRRHAAIALDSPLGGDRMIDDMTIGQLAARTGLSVRTLRFYADASLAEVAATHARALDAQIRTLRLQRAVLRAVATTTDPKELQRMTDLTPP